jgi:hypothetical protein
MSIIRLCHTAETVEVPLRRSINPFPNIYYPYELFSSEDWEEENFGHVASKLIEAWIVLCSSSSSRPENPRLQRNPRSSSSGSICHQCSQVSPIPQRNKGRTAKSLISGCTEGHSLPVSEIWDS